MRWGWEKFLQVSTCGCVMNHPISNSHFMFLKYIYKNNNNKQFPQQCSIHKVNSRGWMREFKYKKAYSSSFVRSFVLIRNEPELDHWRQGHSAVLLQFIHLSVDKYSHFVLWFNFSSSLFSFKTECLIYFNRFKLLLQQQLSKTDAFGDKFGSEFLIELTTSES